MRPPGDSDRKRAYRISSFVCAAIVPRFGWPVTKRVESKKVYDRKKNSRVRYEDEREFFFGAM
jgi:hypothetical protein